MWRHFDTEDSLFDQHQVQTAYAVLPALYRECLFFFAKVYGVQQSISQPWLQSETFLFLISRYVILRWRLLVLSVSSSQVILAGGNKCVADGSDDTSESAPDFFP